MNTRTLLGLLIVVSTLFYGCAVPNRAIDTSGAVYYPRIPLGVTTIVAAEKELVTLLMSPVTINYYATQRFPNHQSLKDYVDKTNPNTGLATEIHYFINYDPILQVNAKGIDISGGILQIPIFPLFFEDLAGFSIKVNGTEIDLPNRMKLIVRDGAERAERVADLLFFIQQNIVSLNKNKQAEFEKKAAEYRGLQTKPKMEEEQRKFIVQANAFNQQKNYGKAIEKYLKAVDIDSTSYPAAYSNLGLLYAQQGNLRRAIYHMKQYLLLEPEAKDARSARDKIYEWEGILETR